MKYLIFIIFLSINLYSYNTELWNKIIGASYTEHKSSYVLERICDEAGGRLAGSEKNKKALKILEEELENIGYEAIYEEFEMPGWYRGNDVVEMIEPTNRKLRAYALGYVDSKPEFIAEIVDAGSGTEEEFKKINCKGKIALVKANKTSRSKIILIAADNGAEAVLFTNKKEGGQVTCGVANFFGNPAPIPAYTITKEEGEWLKRLTKRNVPVKIRIKTNSYCTDEPIKEYNLRVSLEGKTDKRVVIGAHVDAWDIGNGGVDNGQGTAIIYDMAYLLKKYSPNNECSIDFVWFNAEELGLWGSRAYADAHKDENIIAMINLDMTGTPIGINNFGYTQFRPFFEGILENINGFNWSKGVVDNPWTNSDHIFFMLQGIPSFNVWGHLDKPQYHWYHDFSDTFDKQNKRYLADAAGIISVITYELANNPDVPVSRMNKEETIEFMKKHNLIEQLKRQGWWELD